MLKNGSRDLGAGFNVSPLKNIREAKARLDYFAAFALSGAYIEYYTFLKLRERYNENQINNIKHRGAGYLVDMLFHGDEKRAELRKNIQDIINERNDMVHPKDQIVNKYVYDEKREELLDLAIECIKELMELK